MQRETVLERRETGVVVRNGLAKSRLIVLMVALALISGLFLAACGGGGEKTDFDPNVTPAGPANSFNVTLTDNKIIPASMGASMGIAIFHIKNGGSQVHNLAIDMNGRHYQSPNLQPGQSTTWYLPLMTPSPSQLYSSLDGQRDKGLEANIYVDAGSNSYP